MKDSTMMGLIGFGVAMGIMGFISMTIYFTINPNKEYEISVMVLTIVGLVCAIVVVNRFGKNSKEDLEE